MNQSRRRFIKLLVAAPAFLMAEIAASPLDYGVSRIIESAGQVEHLKSYDIELSQWILADGNYEFVNFEVGKKIKFALEFFAEQFSDSSEILSLTAVEKHPSRYMAVGEVIFQNREAWVLDFGGVLAFRSGPSAGFKVGQRLSALLSLHVDPFFYYESLFKIRGIPPLIYEWEVTGIDMSVKPPTKTSALQDIDEKLISIDKIGPLESHELGLNVSYILHCALTGSAPSKTI